MTLQLASRPDGSATHLELVPPRGLPGGVSGAATDDQAQPEQPGLDDQIIALLANTNSPQYRSQLRSELKVNNQRLGLALASLEHRGAILRKEQGWVLARQPAHRPDLSQLQLLG